MHECAGSHTEDVAGTTPKSADVTESVLVQGAWLGTDRSNDTRRGSRRPEEPSRARLIDFGLSINTENIISAVVCLFHELLLIKLEIVSLSVDQIKEIMPGL